MLDEFLTVAYQADKRASDYRELVQDLVHLPNEELYALAEGTAKLASFCGDEDSWLSKFQGTPMYEQALALEQEDLEIDIARQQKRLQEEQTPPPQEEFYQMQDKVRLKKRILDLELNKVKLQEMAGAAGGGQVPQTLDAQQPASPAAPAPAAPEAPVAEAPKVANVLTEHAREEIKPKNFAIPKGKHYPIENETHARNAIARVDQFGSPSEKNQVYSAVAKKYPGLAARSSVPAVKAKEKDSCMKNAEANFKEAAKKINPEHAKDSYPANELAKAEAGGRVGGGIPAGIFGGIAGVDAARGAAKALNTHAARLGRAKPIGRLLGAATTLGGALTGGVAGAGVGGAIGGSLSRTAASPGIIMRHGKATESKKKEAGVPGAMLGGLQAAGKFVKGVAPGIAGIAKSQGVKAGLGAVKQDLGTGLHAAGQWAARNPGAAAGLGAAGVGAAGAGGALVGRETAPSR